MLVGVVEAVAQRLDVGQLLEGSHHRGVSLKGGADTSGCRPG
jgi:hypothetical protein